MIAETGSPLGDRIKHFRVERGFTQRQMAKAIGVSAAAVCHWEAGRVVPRAQTLNGLSLALGLSIDELVGQTPFAEDRKSASASQVIARACHDIALALSVDISEVHVTIGATEAQISTTSAFGSSLDPDRGYLAPGP